MGRMKDLYMDLLHANDGHIPQEATIADLQRMRDLEIFEWKEYEQLQEKNRLQLLETKNPKENKKEIAKQRQQGSFLKSNWANYPKRINVKNSKGAYLAINVNKKVLQKVNSR
jgi:hypothetical protein